MSSAAACVEDGVPQIPDSAIASSAPARFHALLIVFRPNCPIWISDFGSSCGGPSAATASRHSGGERSLESALLYYII